MRQAYLTVLLLVAASAPAWSTTVYKWVDDAGVVHFSDTPRPGAVKMEIGSPQTYSAAAATANLGSMGAPASGPARAPAAAVSCAIDSPSNDQVFMDVDTVSGHASISPAPGAGETVSVTLDGVDVPGGASGSFQLSVERGTHTVALKVLGADGNARCQSSVTFHVRNQSRIAPPLTTPTAPGVQNPNRPRS